MLMVIMLEGDLGHGLVGVTDTMVVIESMIVLKETHNNQ